MLNYATHRLSASLDKLESALKDAVTDVAASFGSDLDSLVTRAYRGKTPILVFAAEMNTLLATYIRAAYLDGLAEGGVDEDEIDDADRRVISQMIQGQRSYVDGFATAVMDAQNENDLRAEIDKRVVYWSRSIAGAGMAGLNSAKANEVVEWQLGATDHHCTGPGSCVWLDGQRHRRSWYAERGFNEGVPGASMPCGGYNCGCQKVPVAGLRSSMISHGIGKQ